MAKKKIVWLDDRNVEHATEESADRANIRIKAEKVLGDYGGLPVGGLIFLEQVNHQTLAPLQAYIDLLVRESMERTEKYG